MSDPKTNWVGGMPLAEKALSDKAVSLIKASHDVSIRLRVVATGLGTSYIVERFDLKKRLVENIAHGCQRKSVATADVPKDVQDALVILEKYRDKMLRDLECSLK